MGTAVLPVGQLMLIIFAMGVVTLISRAFPFVLFDRKGNPPRAILYIGRVLPPAVIAMLVVYSFKSVDFTAPPFGIYEIGAGVLVALLHAKFKNCLVSVFGGTAFYMFLVQEGWRAFLG